MVYFLLGPALSKITSNKTWDYVKYEFCKLMEYLTESIILVASLSADRLRTEYSCEAFSTQALVTSKYKSVISDQ
jgi:hypothetical protein